MTGNLKAPADAWVTLQNLRVGLRFLYHLPRYLQARIDSESATAILADRLRTRDAAFLRQLELAVFSWPESPYLPLFTRARLGYRDAVELVRKDGVEQTLRLFLKEGIYLSVDEFKGRRELIRGNHCAQVSPKSFQNPESRYMVAASSGGSRSSGTPVLFDLEFIRSCAVNSRIVHELRGGSRWEKTTWEVPGGGARFRLLKYSLYGPPIRAWFSQVDPAAGGLHPVYRWSTRAMRWGSYLSRQQLPKPLFSPISEPRPLFDWIDQVRLQGRTPLVFTFPSSAVALAQWGAACGRDLEGVQFTVSGEPITAARLETIRSLGGTVGARYGSVETGPLAYGCLNPTAPDHCHFQSDLWAVIQAGEEGAALGLRERSLLITGLDPRAPFLFLNTSMGDEAHLTNGSCGCPLENMGWNLHVSGIRSIEKLTSAGMTFAGTDVIAVLEQNLPGKYGGIPTDYQLVEEEAPDGRPLLKLLVHPRLGPLDAEAVREDFLAGLGSRTIVDRLMETAWREAGLLTVERRPPLQTKQGKVLHFHVLGSKVAPH